MKVGSWIPDKKAQKYFRDLELVALVPHSGYDCNCQFVKCLANMIAYSWMYGLKIYLIGHTTRMVVDWARNSLALLAKDSENEYTGNHFTHILWLDDDHLFNPDLAVVLANNRVDMCSALYFARCSPHTPSAYVRDFSGNKYRHFPIVEYPHCLAEVDACGFGAMLMKREIFDNVPEPWFTIDYNAGEDIAFCAKAKEYGYQVWVDGRYRLGHIGEPTIITESYYNEFKEKNPNKFSDKMRVKMGGKLVTKEGM